MEYFDVLDQNRISLNYKKLRGETLNPEEFNAGIEMWIVNNNSILMTQRSMNKSHPGQWEVPGGCCQAGESVIDTVKRELSEEIGIEFSQDEFKLIGTELYKKQFVDVFYSEKQIKLQETSLQTEEVKNIKFVSKEDFNKMKNNNEIVPSVLNRFNLFKTKLNLNW